jgi:hypothetical protein
MTGNEPIQFTDEDGAPYGVKHVANKPRVSAVPYLYDVAEGKVPSHWGFRAHGFNSDVDAAEETVWNVGGEYIFPTSACQMEVVSTNASDTTAGEGAITVMVHYLDTNYREESATVTMNGTTPVATSATDIMRINSFYIDTAGYRHYAKGNIDIRHVNNEPIYARIPAGGASEHQAVWTVPSGTSGYITRWGGGVGHQTGGRMARFCLKATCDNDDPPIYRSYIFDTKDMVVTQDSSFQVPFTLPIKCPAKTDIKICARSDNVVANALTNASIEGWYEK